MNCKIFHKKLLLIMMEICKAPTLRLKQMNKHNIAHIIYIEMENVISKLTKNEYIMLISTGVQT